MFELRNGIYYIAFLLGFCNMIVGCTSKYFIMKFMNSYGWIEEFTLITIGYMSGSLISEYICKKFSQRKSLILIWLSYLLSSLMFLPIVINKNSHLSSIFSAIGLHLNFFTQAIMIICEVRILKETIKSYPSTYSISLLYSLNELPWVFSFLVSELDIWQAYLMLIISIFISVLVTWKIKEKPSTSIIFTKDKYQHTILPFSAFALEFFSYGVLNI